MAHVQKFSRGVVRHIIGHCSRTESAENKNVDSSLSPKNIYLVPEDNGLEEIPKEEIFHRYQERLKEVHVSKRKDLVTGVSLVVTAPRDLPPEDVDAFMKASVEFAAERYGRKNIIAGCVHKDEPGAQPHVHILYIPVTWDVKKNQEKVCAREVVNRNDLRSLHDDLSRFISKSLGKDIQMTNGVTKEAGGNRTMSQLKYDTVTAALKKQQIALDREQADLGRQRIALDSQQAQVSDECFRLLNQETALRQQKEANEKESKRLADLLSEINAAKAAAKNEADKLAAKKAAIANREAAVAAREAAIADQDAALNQQRELNAQESKRLANLLSEINAAKAAAKNEADKLAAEKAAIADREAALDERERVLERKVAQADLDFLAEMAERGFSGDELQVFKMIPHEQWEMMRESLIFADKPGKERLEKMAESVQYEKRSDGPHVIVPYPVMEAVRPIWRKLEIFDRENRDFQLIVSRGLYDRQADKRVDAAVLSESPSKEDALAAFCGGKEIMAAWRKDMRKAAVERTFQRFGLTAAKTWSYDRGR